LTPLGLADGCQPLLGGADCFLPYPSDFYRVEDANGSHLAITGAAEQRTQTGVLMDVNRATPADGSSTIPTLVAMFPEAVVGDGFARLEEGGDPSLSASTSNTLIVEAGTTSLVPHFVDLDAHATDPKRKAIVMHTFVGLKPTTKYVVLVKGVKNDAGALVAAPEGFRRLRDKQTAGDPQLAPLAKPFEDDVFAAAKALGVDRATLQLGWAFTTGADEWATKDLLQVRDLTRAWLAANATTFTVTKVENPTSGNVFRTVAGHFTVPLFLESTNPAAKLSRDANGKVKQNGTAEADFLVVVPVAVKDGPAPGNVAFYGHGFFGNLDELTGGGAVGVANATGRSLVGTVWWGMSLSDVPTLADALTGSPAKVMSFADRVHQAMANWMVLTGSLAALEARPELQRADSTPLLGGPANAYIGISQGHILGGTMAALNPTLDRIVLNVGGAGFVGMMMRARPFMDLLNLLAIAVPDPLEQQKLLATYQRLFDRFEPGSYARYLVTETLPGNPEKRVLMQAGLGDDEVPNLGTFLHARLAGVPLMQPSPWAPWGIPNAASGATTALELYDLKVGDPNVLYRAADFQPEENGVHNGVRQDPRALEQMKRFWNEGTVQHVCTGPCVKQ
jgi:hypothetical protein